MPPLAESKSRIHWIDYAKGIGIFLVVFGHVLIGMRVAAFTTFPDWIDQTIFYIYTFHMPLFFLLSGFVFPITKDKSLVGFTQSSIINIFVPYLIWNIVFALLKNISPSPVNVPVSLADIPTVILHPVQHFWFLPYLFFIRFLYWGAERAAGARGREIFAVVTTAWYVIASAFSLDFGGTIDPRFYMGMAFFGLGCLLEPRGGLLTAAHRFTALLGAVVLWFGLALLLHLNGIGAIKPFAALVGVVAVVSLALLLPAPHTRWTQVLGFLGEASLAIYVSHGVFAAAVRIFLVKLHVVSIPVHIVLGTVAGLVFPVFLVLLANRLKISPFVGLGRNWSSRYLPPPFARQASPVASPGGQ